jgi:hypothetical protein
MTWQAFFDLSTQDHRHILATYSLIILVNLVVLGRLIYSWNHPKS